MYTHDFHQTFLNRSVCFLSYSSNRRSLNKAIEVGHIFDFSSKCTFYTNSKSLGFVTYNYSWLSVELIWLKPAFYFFSYECLNSNK
jgi:hypothetical protein